MRIAILGQDRRYQCLRELLRRAGVDLSGPAEADWVVTPWPAPVDLPEGTRLVTCGPAAGPSGAMDLLRDEEYQGEIARMTAEGAIFAAMAAGEGRLEGEDCLVAGWGRIGRALTAKLAGLGARVTALTRRKSAFGEIQRMGAIPRRTELAAQALAGKKFLFSTAPAMVFDGRALTHARKDVRIFDLASPPYGVDFQAAETAGLWIRRERGVPGRYCPQAAAGAIAQAMKRGGILS